jgi:hypothetical protein
MIFFLAGDILYSLYFTPYTDGVAPYRDIDLFWGLAYLFFTYGLFVMTSLIKNAQNKISEIAARVSVE